MHRRLKKSNKGFPIPEKIYSGAVIDLVKLAKMEGHALKNGAELNDLELLAELQHYGAATCLIDFTKNPLVALWFACQPPSTNTEQVEDGKVVALDVKDKFPQIEPENLDAPIEDLLREKIWLYSPKKQNNRIVAQQSVFVFGEPVITEHVKFCKVDDKSKNKILEELRDISISAESLFCDFDGFARENSSEKVYRPLAGKFYNLGEDYAKKKEWGNALKNYTRAIELNPNNPVYYFARGNAKYDLGEYRAAIDDYNKAISLDPNNSATYNNRGNAKSNLGEHPAAIDDFNKALEINPNDAVAYNNRGAAKSDLREYQAAIDDFNKALEINPNYAEAYNNRGATQGNLGEYESAIDDFNKAIKINPNYAEAYYNRGITKHRLGDKAGAKADYHKANQLDPQIEIPEEYK